MKLAAFLILFSLPVYADSGWQLDLYVYSSATGHGLGDGTYLAEFRLPAESSEECNRMGNAGLKYFKSGVLVDNSVTLAGFSCEEAP